MTMYVPDNYDQYRQHEARQEAELAKFPVCYECGERILDDWAYEYNDELICERCLHQNHRKWTVDCCE